jgi:hypothetical protein
MILEKEPDASTLLAPALRPDGALWEAKGRWREGGRRGGRGFSERFEEHRGYLAFQTFKRGVPREE